MPSPNGLMVVFGAGASYDGIPSLAPPQPRNERLPLANQLFEERFADKMSYFPEMHAVVPYLQVAGVNVEEALERLSGEAAEHVDRHSQLMAVRYYLQLMIKQVGGQWYGVSGGRTNFKTLFDQMRHWVRPASERIIVVTFNYDLLIEQALSADGRKIQSLPDYLNGDRFQLFKLHGSVNWVREIDSPAITSERPPWDVVRGVISNAAQVKVSDRFGIVEEIPATLFGATAAVPAIAIPLQQKAFFECPAAHLEQLKSGLANVSRILLVGWRAGEQHFLQLLTSSISQPVEVFAVAGNDQEGVETIDRLARAGLVIQKSGRAAGFTSFVIGRLGEKFLRG